MLELLSNTLQRTEQDCTATALVEKLGKNATCLKVQANLDLTGRPGARDLCQMEILNFLWLNWDQYLPLAPT